MNSHKEEILEQRLAEFKQAIKTDQKKELDKIKARGEVEEAAVRKKILEENMDREKERFRKKYQSLNVDAKIRKSAKINEGRMAKMNSRYELTQKLKTTTREALKRKIQDDKIYKELLVKLIVQGLIKLMDEEVEVKCLKKDIPIVKSILKQSQEQFNKISQEQTTSKTQTKLSLNEGQTLDSEYKELLGGIVLSSLRGRISCINTLDARLNYCLDDMLPNIRKGLFDS